MKIRPYTSADFEMISSWWKAVDGTQILPGMMCENGSFVLEVENMPALCLTVLLTQSKDMAYLEFFIKNPAFKKLNLEAYGIDLFNHCKEWTKSQGYSRLIAFAEIPKLKEKYQRAGMKKTIEHLTGFLAEL